MKTTLDLPDELIREVKLRAVEQGRTVKDLVAEFLRQGLGMTPLGKGSKQAGSCKVQIGLNGLPVIRCSPNAPAAGMSAPKIWMDAYLAAYAISGALRLVTTDGDFKCYQEQGLDLLLLRPAA